MKLTGRAAFWIVDDFVYLPMPKAGSQAIERQLQRRHNGQKSSCPTDADGKTTWTVCRNPYDRAVSMWWAMCHRNPGDQKYGTAGLSLADFLARWEPWDCGDDRGPWNGSRGLLQTQERNLRGWRVDILARFETLQKHWEALPFVAPGEELARRNATRERTKGEERSVLMAGHWVHQYDDRTVALVNDRFGDDFDRFGYEKADGHDRLKLLAC